MYSIGIMKVKVRVPISRQAWGKSTPHKRKDKVLPRKAKHKQKLI